MLTYHKDPKGLAEKTRTILDTSISLFENIKNNYPNGFDHEVTDIYLNGEKINPLSYDLSRIARDTDEIIIVNRQQGVETLIIAAVAIITAVATYLLMPKPNDPDGGSNTKTSSNNTLTGQTNIARLYQAKPDIYGKVRVYPDIVNPASSEYIDNVKYLQHLFCIGTGFYDVQKVKYDETLLDKITDTRYTVYNPGDIIPKIRYQFKSAEIDGQEVTPPNLSTDVTHEDKYTNIQSFEAVGGNGRGNLTGGTATITLNDTDDITYWQNLTPPTLVQFSISAVLVSRYNNSYIPYNTNITYKGVLSSINDKVLVISNLDLVSYGVKYLGILYSITYNNNNFNLQSINGGTYTDAFNLPKAGSELWVDLLFPNGLKGEVVLDFVYWQIDDNGNEIPNSRQTYNWSITLNTSEQQHQTVKIIPEAGFSKYAMVIGRTNNGKEDLSDQVKIESVSTVSYDENVVAKDTLIFVETKATEQAIALKELKFNAVVTRKTITYNTDTKEIDYNIKPSRSFADAILHSFVMSFQRDPSEIDLDNLYAINRKIVQDDERLGYFDFSFDDIDVSLGDRVQTACNAARVFTYRDGQKWRFVRDEVKTRPAAMFNALNLVNSNDGGTIQKKSSLPSSYDGVQLEYVNSSEDNAAGNDKKAYVNLKIKNGTIVEEPPFRPKKIQLTGCRNLAQAMNRAQLEVRRLIYERTYVEDEVISDANFVDKGDLVLYADTYDETVASGEITSINGNRFFVDQELQLDKTKSYRVAITNKKGYPSDWLPITAHDKSSFTANFNEAYIADDINIQLGSIFIITELISSEPTEFLLTQKQYNDGTYKINLTNYDKRIYEYDAT